MDQGRFNIEGLNTILKRKENVLPSADKISDIEANLQWGLDLHKTKNVDTFKYVEVIEKLDDQFVRYDECGCSNSAQILKDAVLWDAILSTAEALKYQDKLSDIEQFNNLIVKTDRLNKKCD